MAYDEALAERVRTALGVSESVAERKMFGGLTFMVQGHMCCGIVGDELMLHLGDSGAQTALGQPHTRAMDFTGKPMKGMIYVGVEGITSDQDLTRWVQHAKRFVRTLPPK